MRRLVQNLHGETTRPWNLLRRLRYEVAEDAGVRFQHFVTGGIGGDSAYEIETRELADDSEDVDTQCPEGERELLWEVELSGPASAQPMTYVFQGKQYLVVTVGGMGVWKEELVAFALP